MTIVEGDVSSPLHKILQGCEKQRYEKHIVEKELDLHPATRRIYRGFPK